MFPSKKNTLTRRSFLKKAVVASTAVAPMIIPSSALGLGKSVAPSNRIVMASIGIGGQAQYLMRNAIQQPDSQIVALCDINRPKAESVKGTVDKHYENTDCKTYGDFREVIARDDIDALIIAPPDHWHAIPCIQAAHAKKDIYCEKPLTRTLEEGQAVVKAAEANNIILQVGSMQRSDNRMKQACELVRNGYIGKVKHINVGLPDGGHKEYVSGYDTPVPEGVDYDMWIGPAEHIPYHPRRMDWNWRWWMGIGGGNLMDWIGHHGDIAHMGMDWDNRGPQTVKSEIWTMEKDVNPNPALFNLYNDPVSYRSLLTYKEGTTMTVGSTNVMPEIFTQHKDTGTQWVGENGDWVFVSRGTINSNKKELLETKFADNDFRFRPERNHMRDFMDCVKSRKQPSAPARTGHRSASIGHLSVIACKLGKTLDWDETNERFTNSRKANNMLGDTERNGWTMG